MILNAREGCQKRTLTYERFRSSTGTRKAFGLWLFITPEALAQDEGLTFHRASRLCSLIHVWMSFHAWYIR